MNGSFKPFDVLEEGLRYWWLVTLLILIGGAAGWLYHTFQPPVFEASASIAIGVDYTRTGNIDIQKEDKLLEVVADEMEAGPVQQAVLAQAQSQNVALDLETWKRISFIERRDHSCILRVRDTDPQKASLLANWWAEAAYSSLTTSYAHAVKAQGLQRYLDSLESCLQKVTVNAPALAACQVNSLAELQNQLAETGKVFLEEKIAARGVTPALVISSIEKASLPKKPALFDRNKMTLAGLVLGLLAAVIGFYLRLPSRLFKR
jgi:hypothetical protein